jgi:hypothetical protein
VIKVGVGNETNFLYYPASIEQVVAIEAEGYPAPKNVGRFALQQLAMTLHHADSLFGMARS